MKRGSRQAEREALPCAARAASHLHSTGLGPVPQAQIRQAACKHKKVSKCLPAAHGSCIADRSGLQCGRSASNSPPIMSGPRLVQRTSIGACSSARCLQKRGQVATEAIHQLMRLVQEGLQELPGLHRMRAAAAAGAASSANSQKCGKGNLANLDRQ